MASANGEGSMVPMLGQSIKDDCDANTRRGGQSVGSRFSQQVQLVQLLLICALQGFISRTCLSMHMRNCTRNNARACIA
eukprot:scaffold186030_cov27-Tisochrysis_lutea.AAC.1